MKKSLFAFIGTISQDLKKFESYVVDIKPLIVIDYID